MKPTNIMSGVHSMIKSANQRNDVVLQVDVILFRFFMYNFLIYIYIYELTKYNFVRRFGFASSGNTLQNPKEPIY